MIIEDEMYQDRIKIWEQRIKCIRRGLKYDERGKYVSGVDTNMIKQDKMFQERIKIW